MWLFVLAREALMEVSTTSNASLSPSGCAFTVQHTSWIHFLHLHTRSLFWGSGLSDHQSSKHKSAQELRPASLASIKKKNKRGWQSELLGPFLLLCHPPLRTLSLRFNVTQNPTFFFFLNWSLEGRQGAVFVWGQISKQSGIKVL